MYHATHDAWRRHLKQCNDAYVRDVLASVEGRRRYSKDYRIQLIEKYRPIPPVVPVDGEEADADKQVITQHFPILATRIEVLMRSINRGLRDEMGYGIREILEGDRRREICHGRHAATYILKKYTDMSLPQIGRHTGGRHHSTVLSSLRAVEESPNHFSRLIAAIEMHLQMSTNGQGYEPIDIPSDWSTSEAALARC
jgi:hypothetical protein